MSVNQLDDRLDMRISSADKSAFVEKCKQSGFPPALVLRQLITAYTEEQLTINQKVVKS